MIQLPLPVTARWVILGIVSWSKLPCLKFELMGCEVEPPQQRHLGFNNGFPVCVDNEPPAFRNCPENPIVVQKGPGGFLLPVNFTQPVAVDNSGSIARSEVRPDGFALPLTTFEDMMIEYIAYDYDGNVAICQVNITVPDDTPPSLTCPQSFVIELVDEKTEYFVNFRDLRNLVNTSDPSGEVTVKFTPERANIKTGDYQNVTVDARDKHGNLATCHFQVTIQPTPCVAWELKPPAHGNLDCDARPNGYSCVATCNAGYRFTDGQEQLTYSCSSGEPRTSWIPSRVVPDCVTENTVESTYDVVSTISYKSQSAEIPPACINQYIEVVEQNYEQMSQDLSARCSAGGVNIQVNFKKTVSGDVRGNSLDLIYTMMVDPSISQPRIYDICGQVHALIFDISIASSNDVIDSLLEVDAGDQCPSLKAHDSSVFRGFACNAGEVLNKIADELVPRCLECPAGFFAGRNASSCTRCPLGMYQDEARQGECKACPAGRWTKDEGSKSIVDCVPVCGYGTYSPTGLVPCLECPRNTYSQEPPSDGYKSCDNCPEEMFTFQPGTKDPDQCREKCSPGYYSPNGLAPCAPCPLNHFQPLSGQRECFKCQSGEETTTTGASSKDDCKPVVCSPGQCSNGGQCVPIQHKPKCYCPAGFTGQYCDINVDECASRPCYNGATCVDQAQGYTCECPEGFSGLQCQIEESDCVEGACPDRAMCKDLPGPGNYECLCRDGFKGDNCDITTDPCSENENPCNNGAACRTLPQGRYTCQCAEGWEGTHCENNINDCLEQPCLLGANCTDLIHDFSCSCPRGFSGKRCELKTDLCDPDPCVRGQCVDKLFRYECVCEPGWEGPDCDVNINDCKNSPCQNNGLCTDDVNGYSCFCEPGFTGKNCQHTVDYCAVEPCKNGATCTNEGEEAVCSCRPGFSGKDCGTENDECINGPCDPAGSESCVDLENKFECICREGYKGEFCEVNINDCESSPCRNGGECLDLVGDYECRCPQGWVGKNCEEDEKSCTEATCENNALCVDLFQDFFCACPSGTDGKKCETAPKRCIGDPCMNGGACKDLGFDLSCSCSADYSGIGCQYEYDACAEGACQNGATCIDNGKGYKCLCPDGFEGANCETNINDCDTSACPAAAQCIDLTNDYYCKCPPGLTGEDCRKPITINYDLHFTDEGKASSASLVIPFEISSEELSIAMWVQFDNAGETGTYFTLFAVGHMHYAINKRVMVQAQNGGVHVELFQDEAPIFLQFPKQVRISDGGWHHVALIWSGKSGELLLTADGILGDRPETAYGAGKTLQEYGYVTLGSTDTDEGRSKTESGFTGKLTRVQAWNRALDDKLEIPNQVKVLGLNEDSARFCKDAPILLDGLILRWSGYEKTVGGIERIMPSICGKTQCIGSGCDTNVDKIPPIVVTCPGDVWVADRNGSTPVKWNEPVFRDDRGVSLLNIQKPDLSPGQVLQWGAYEIAYIAYDEAGNSATCHFKIYVVKEFCPPIGHPQGGTQTCEEWGPGNIFKTCSIKCDPGKKFSQPVPQFYTCGAEGFWRPSPNKNPAAEFVYPVCSDATPAQKIFRIKLQYLAQVLCHEGGQNVLKDKIISALQGLNEEWRFSACPKLDKNECKDFGVDVNCVKKASNKVKRQADEVDQKYDLEISLPTLGGDDAINIKNGRREKIQRLLEEIILNENNLDIDSRLPGAVLDSVDISESFACPTGSIVIDGTCVPCPHGTYYDQATDSCTNCAIGYYNSKEAQLSCTKCPEVNGVTGTTENEGSTKMSDCKETCDAGRYYSREAVSLTLMTHNFKIVKNLEMGLILSFRLSQL